MGQISTDQPLFLSTLSLRRATVFCRALQNKFSISIHALLAESDEYWVGGYGTANNFYPRSPCGERHGGRRQLQRHRDHFYPRSPCGERHPPPGPRRPDADISIHALLAESDTYPSQCRTFARDFYPRSPCGERLASSGIVVQSNNISIHALLAESDKRFNALMQQSVYFYPRSPCGERLSLYSVEAGFTNFYPRSPCGERQMRGIYYD